MHSWVHVGLVAHEMMHPWIAGFIVVFVWRYTAMSAPLPQ